MLMKEYINLSFTKKCDMMLPLVQILLSTYNGGKFLEQQLDSIIKQSYKNWRIVIRDDGSKDNTVDIIKSYVNKYCDKIIFIEDNYEHLGACQSFSRLLHYTSADYIMFCDQDDIWLPEKIEVSVMKMKELEATYNNVPILVHSNLKLIDSDLNIISNSFWKYQKLNPKLIGINNLIIQNNVTGCTMMINKTLKELCAEIPEKAIMHDWWIALVTSAFGVFGYINRPLVLYRQHDKNDIGAKKYSFFSYFKRLGKFYDSMKSNYEIIEQCSAFMSQYSGFDTYTLQMLQSFSEILNKSRASRLHCLAKYRIRKYGVLRNMGFIINIFYAKRNYQTSI